MAKAATAPFFDVDFTKFAADFKVPGVDVDAVLAAQRRNFEAVTAANQLAIEGLQAVMRRQAEITRQAVEEAGAMVNQLFVAKTPEDKVAAQAELVKVGFEKALANLKELAELVTKANGEAADVLTKRVSEGLDELKVAVQKNGVARK